MTALTDTRINCENKGVKGAGNGSVDKVFTAQARGLEDSDSPKARMNWAGMATTLYCGGNHRRSRERWLTRLAEPASSEFKYETLP